MNQCNPEEVNRALCFLAYFLGRLLVAKLADDRSVSFSPAPTSEMGYILSSLLEVLACCGPQYILRLHWLRDLGVAGRSTRTLARILWECVNKAKKGSPLSPSLLQDRHKNSIARLPQRDLMLVQLYCMRALKALQNRHAHGK